MSRRKKLTLVALVVMLLVVGVGAVAWGQQHIRLIVNGREIYPDVPPQIISGRTMVPLRAVAEALGAGVRWDEATLSVEVTRTTEASPILVKQAYLLIWDSLYKQLAEIHQEAGELSISGIQSPQDLFGNRFAVSQSFQLLSGRVDTLFETLSKQYPPPELLALHRETLRELVLWSTGYELTAKALVEYDQSLNVKPFADKAYQQSSKVWALRKAGTE